MGAVNNPLIREKKSYRHVIVWQGKCISCACKQTGWATDSLEQRIKANSIIRDEKKVAVIFDVTVTEDSSQSV